MKTPTKLLLAAATLYPLAYMFAFVAVWLFLLASAVGGHFPELFAKHPHGPPPWFLGLFAVHLLTMFWVLGLLIFYIQDVFKNPRLDEQKRVLWALVLFMGNMVAMPVYWYVYIWPAETGRQRTSGHVALG